MISASILAIVVVALVTAAVVIAVIGLHVWGAIMDGREARKSRDET